MSSIREVSEEPQGKIYLALLQFAALRCEQFSLVRQEQIRFNASADAVTAELTPYLISERRTDSWPGTRLLGSKAQVRYYKVTPAAMQILAKPGRLYGWISPDFPEDLAFYSAGQAVWLETIAHEKIARFQDKTLTREEILQHVPGLKFFPAIG